MLAACGHPADFTVNGTTKEYPTYGLINRDEARSKNICYELSVGNVIWSIIGVETVIIPLYLIGFSIYNPVRVAGPDGCGL
jgi:hypothetical protein